MNQLDLLEVLKPPAEVSSEELAVGMHKCFANAGTLLEDARLLLERSPGRALSLAILALEETAKIFILCELAVPAPTVVGSKVRSAIASHARKQYVLASYGRHVLGNPYEVDIPLGLVAHLDRLKQLGFYVDITTQGFLSPQTLGEQNRDWAVWAIEAAQERLDSIAQFHETPEASATFVRRGTLMRELVGRIQAAGGPDSPQATEVVEEFLREVKERDAETSP